MALRAAAGEGKRHDIVMSGAITWCHTCGAYADAKAKGLNFVCKVPPSKLPQGGGPYGQLQKLLAGRRPKTQEQLPPMQRADGSEWLSGNGRYANLRSSGVATTIEPGFYVYEPEVLAER